MDPMERLNRIATGFTEAKVLLAAAELRIFELLRGDGATAAQIAEQVDGSLYGVEILLDALAAMGLLDKRDGVYRNRPEYEPCLLEDSPSHLSAMLRHRNLMFRKWAFLEEKIRGRKPPALAGRQNLTDRAANESFIRAMLHASGRSAPAIVDRLDLNGVRRVADLGGGPGHYLVEIARRLPEAEPYLIDLPLTLEVARKLTAEADPASRLRFVPWDFYREPVPKDLPAMDLVFVSQVIHGEPPERNLALLRRLFKLTAPGGRVVIHEKIVEPERTRPFEAALFAVNMLAMTDGGRTYTEDEILEWARKAGFEPEPGERVDERSALVRFRRKR